MSKFLVIYRQRGGCDYTIGCGIQISTIEAPTVKIAVASVIEGLTKTGDEGGEFGDETVESLARIDVYEIAGGDDAHVSIPRDAWLAAHRTARESAEKARAETKERAELDRLKKKYDR